MNLPPAAQLLVEAAADKVPFARLQKAAVALSDHYRAHQPTAKLKLDGDELLAAYLVTRMPATFAAASAVLAEVRARSPLTPSTMLDIGAGVGAASLAALQAYPDLAATLIEAYPRFRHQARELLPQATLLEGNAASLALPPSDLVMASYLFSELAPPGRRQLLANAWQATRQTLVLIEPGSASGFGIVREARTWLLAQGAHLLAPCPHAGECPVTAPDWCHFAVRLERTSLHRRLKQGQHGWEDEKFSYLIAAREPGQAAKARVIRRPVHHPGFIELALCAPAGLAQPKITKRNKEEFRAARKAGWGDEWLS